MKLTKLLLMSDASMLSKDSFRACLGTRLAVVGRLRKSVCLPFESTILYLTLYKAQSGAYGMSLPLYQSLRDTV